jgi:hypothetical protein
MHFYRHQRGPPGLNGGGCALEVIQHFEENSLRKTDKQIVLENISFVKSTTSSERTPTVSRMFGKPKRKHNLTSSVKITQTERKLILDRNTNTLISSFENMTAIHLCGWVAGRKSGQAREVF